VTRPTRIAIAVMAVLLALSVGGFVWLYVSDRAAAAEWALRDQERVAEITELVKKARFHADKSDAYKAEADDAKTEKAKAVAELEALKAKRRTRSMPKTLGDCREQLAEAEGEIALHTRVAAIDLLTITALEGALGEQTERADLFEQAWLREQDRADGWREYARKKSRRDKVKIAFVGIGAGVGGGLVGYGIGVSR
jgi:hypothetical protein